MNEVMMEAPQLPFPLFRRGKVREMFDLGDELLMVATDRISAFDVILENGIPRKGEVLNRLSVFWFERMRGLMPNHLSGRRLGEFLEDRELVSMLEPRSMIVRKAEPLRFEGIVRGYLAGSGWSEYREKGTVGGIPLPAGLRESEELPEPLFTPSTKGEIGEHDVNMTEEELRGMLGEELAARVKGLSLSVYAEARGYAAERGIIIADTKMEFGMLEGTLVLIDELLTPDSSRFWPADGYAPGAPQTSLDKQYVRDWLRSSGWKEEDGPPALPPEVVENTSRLYLDIYRRLTGEELPA
jgi:phosphoribosylaminoimidazole-succinocarboxamide synthase